MKTAFDLANSFKSLAEKEFSANDVLFSLTSAYSYAEESDLKLKHIALIRNWTCHSSLDRDPVIYTWMLDISKLLADMEVAKVLPHTAPVRQTFGSALDIPKLRQELRLCAEAAGASLVSSVNLTVLDDQAKWEKFAGYILAGVSHRIAGIGANTDLKAKAVREYLASRDATVASPTARIKSVKVFITTAREFYISATSDSGMLHSSPINISAPPAWTLIYASPDTALPSDAPLHITQEMQAAFAQADREGRILDAEAIAKIVGHGPR